MEADSTALKKNDMPYADGHNFEDAVQALKGQLKDGVQSALRDPSFTVDELRHGLGI